MAPPLTGAVAKFKSNLR